MCHGSGSQHAEGHGPYYVESSDLFAVRYVVASDVVGDDVHRYRSCDVSRDRDSKLVYSSKGAAGGQLYGGDGSLAPSDGSE